MIGIYKITSPSNKVYIGQSINIKKRWINYKNLHCKRQPKLYNSFIKYGPENHKFELIEECLESELFDKEIFYKQQFINKFGWRLALFCEIFDQKSGGIRSEETKQKMSKAKIGKKLSEETKLNISKAKKGLIVNNQWAKNISKGKKGFKHTQETKDKIREGNLNKIYSKESKNKISKANKGKKRSEEICQKISIGKKGKKQPKSFFEKKNKSIIQYDLNDKEIKKWNSIKEAADFIGIDSGTLTACLKGRQKTCKNYKWKYE